MRHVEGKLAPAKSCVSTYTWHDTVIANPVGYFITFELTVHQVNDPPNHRQAARYCKLQTACLVWNVEN